MSRTGRIKGIVFLPAFLGIINGCVGIGIPDGQIPVPNDGTPPGDNGTGPGDNGSDLRVTLSVSNPTPRPNESVTLTCSLIGGSVENVSFSFQPSDGRLVVDAVAGTANFIVQESDAGSALNFTCTASDENGAGEPSNIITVIVSS